MAADIYWAMTICGHVTITTCRHKKICSHQYIHRFFKKSADIAIFGHDHMHPKLCAAMNVYFKEQQRGGQERVRCSA